MLRIIERVRNSYGRVWRIHKVCGEGYGKMGDRRFVRRGEMQIVLLQILGEKIYSMACNFFK